MRFSNSFMSWLFCPSPDIMRSNSAMLATSILRDEGPIPLGDEVGHDAHLRHADLRAELGHRQKLLHQRAHLTRLAVHDLANEQHAGLQRSGWVKEELTGTS